MTFSELSTASLAPSSKDLISRKSSLNFKKQNTKFDISEDMISSPEDFAKCFKFYAQFTNPYISFPICFNKISAKTLFKQHKSNFQKFFKLFRKFDLKITDYVLFFISELNMHTSSIDQLFTKETFQKYIKYLDSLAKTDKICNKIINTAKFMANDAKNSNAINFIDYFKRIIAKQQIAPYYMSGKLSPYFLAIIPGFKKVILKLDHFSKEELSSFYKRFDSYAIIAANAIKTKFKMQLSGQQIFEHFFKNTEFNLN